MTTVQQGTPEDIQERAKIDRSARFPVLFFFTSATAWLFVATALGFLSALKLRLPGLGDNFPDPLHISAFFSYGRLMPAHLMVLVYGWAMQAGVGVLLWLMSRLSRCPLRYPVLIVVAGHAWNLAVTIGVVSIIAGYGRSIPWLDFPDWLWPMMAISYLLMTIWVIPMFRQRRSSSVYISELYLVGAAVWFPWIFFTANLLINKGSAPVMGAGTGAWYITNLIYFWMTPIALAAAYYIVPKIVGRPVFSYPLAVISFWMLAFLAGWTGFARYMGGPFPAWMTAVGGAAAIFIVLAVLITVINLHMTFREKMGLMKNSPSLRFTMFGMALLALYVVLAALGSTFGVGKYLQFTYFLSGLDTLAIYGFFSMTMFGAIYFIVPRVTGAEWPSGHKISLHFQFSAYGIGTLFACQVLAGLSQGGNFARWDLPFSASFNTSAPYLAGICFAWLLIGISNIWFFWQLALMFVGKGRKTGEGATLMHAEPGQASPGETAA